MIAYADDLVVITLCKTKLEGVLNKMFIELKTMNLQMRFAFLKLLFSASRFIL
jgi:hypothetical protein